MGTFVSLAGLDLSFMKEKRRGRPKKNNSAAKKPQKVYPDCHADFGFPKVMSDITPFVSPIDGTEISSRSNLKAHERRYRVKQAGDFKEGELVAKENKRVADSLREAEMETAKWL